MSTSTMTIKNRRSKISPGGLVSLPVSARKALGMEIGKSTRVQVAAAKDGVSLSAADQGGLKVSPGGQLVLPGDARAVLLRGATRNYWLEVNDSARTVVLHPYS